MSADGQVSGGPGERGREMTKTLWRCEQLRAGKVYNKVLFYTQREAEQFVRQMKKMEPDLFWRMEAVQMEAVWN